MLEHDLMYLVTQSCGVNNSVHEPSIIISDKEDTISIAKCNKDPAGNRYIARSYLYMCQGTSLNEYAFKWIGIIF